MQTRLQEISAVSDDTDYGTMKALMHQRAKYPDSYNMVREAVACQRAENALQLWAKRVYGREI